MRRRAESLVEKRDGRRESLRATKLARSIHLALAECGIREDWRALDLASSVLGGLRARRADERSRANLSAPQGVAEAMREPSDTEVAALPPLSTIELGEAVQQVLLATGHEGAAAAYRAVEETRARQRRAFVRMAADLEGGGPGDGQREAQYGSPTAVASLAESRSSSHRKGGERRT